MELNILYLYADLMNLYGENGNIRVLTRHLTDQGFTVRVDCRSLGDPLSFDGYAFIYAGSGTESARDAALAHLRPYADALRTAVENGAVLFFTGNAWEMLGASVLSVSGETLPGLSLFPFTVKEDPDRRITGDAVFSCEFLDGPIVGFINKCSEAHGVETPLFSCQMGDGNADGVRTEGLCSGNFYGTHLTGPVLVRNPHLMRHIVEKLGSRFDGWTYRDIAYPYEEKAYAITSSELQKRMEGQK